MRTYHLRIDVTGATDLPGELRTSRMSVHLPDSVDGRVPVLFGFPGGGFGRKYYDVSTCPATARPSSTPQGFGFVACDQLFVGDSSHPDTFALTYENLAEANHAATRRVLDRLAAGTLAEASSRSRWSRSSAWGSRWAAACSRCSRRTMRTFDGVALLGWSGIFTNFPAPDGGRITYPMPPRGTDLRPIADQVLGVVAPDEEQFRFCFHWPDEDPALWRPTSRRYRPYTGVARGDAATPWGSATSRRARSR